MARKVMALLSLVTVLAWGQEHYSSGELKGFTKSPTESVIIHIDDPFVVSVLRGEVSRKGGDNSPLENVLIEIRGPGDSEVIKSAKTTTEGKFQFPHLKPGKYIFKATTLGFQSIVGVVVVSPGEKQSHVVTLKMRPGV